MRRGQIPSQRGSNEKLPPFALLPVASVAVCRTQGGGSEVRATRPDRLSAIVDTRVVQSRGSHADGQELVT